MKKFCLIVLCMGTMLLGGAWVQTIAASTYSDLEESVLEAWLNMDYMDYVSPDGIISMKIPEGFRGYVDEDGSLVIDREWLEGGPMITIDQEPFDLPSSSITLFQQVFYDGLTATADGYDVEDVAITSVGEEWYGTHQCISYDARIGGTPIYLTIFVEKGTMFSVTFFMFPETARRTIMENIEILDSQQEDTPSVMILLLENVPGTIPVLSYPYEITGIILPIPDETYAVYRNNGAEGVIMLSEETVLSVEYEATDLYATLNGADPFSSPLFEIYSMEKVDEMGQSKSEMAKLLGKDEASLTEYDINSQLWYRFPVADGSRFLTMKNGIAHAVTFMPKNTFSLEETLSLLRKVSFRSVTRQ